MAIGSNGLNVSLVIYKKIVDGDLSKFTATSNITQSGGGARDLRFNPSVEFFPAFQRMFRQSGSTLKGYFSWANEPDTEVEVHPPTNARPNEIRIGKIHECFPQSVIPNDATDCILLIVLDGSGKVFPYFTSQYSLMHDNWHPEIKEPILAGLNAQRNSKTTAMGFVDFDSGRSYTNGLI